ncbi:hypothetical protein EJ04DRAFT_570076 [Polyplosphaeria fusca]|uniref:DUF7924 domain-containing protein n=1 Tax=Polyplosphaeria fusca TaxID=682080 RepID=A0A9P4QLR0_9PLEO|nr:hypothetical protein EJ04DRAFT_570076 [Polyplosphaeria fusca]
MPSSAAASRLSIQSQTYMLHHQTRHYTLSSADHRHPIASFSILQTEQGDNRWTAYTFVRNIYDLGLLEHFSKICSAIDMLPADLNFEVFEQPELQAQDAELASSRSGLSQCLESYGVDDNRGIRSVQPNSPDTTIRSKSIKYKKKER